jgi:hypothetical protein
MISVCEDPQKHCFVWINRAENILDGIKIIVSYGSKYFEN